MQTIITNGRLKSVRLTGGERRKLVETKVLLSTLTMILPSLVGQELVAEFAEMVERFEKVDGKVTADEDPAKILVVDNSHGAVDGKKSAKQ